MSEMNRVQRWRQRQREAGKETLTVWLPRAMRLYIEDMALKRHCSPSDLIQQALTTCYPLSADVTVTVTDTSVTDTIVTDTSQIRSILQQELRAFFGESPPYQGIPPVHGVTDTIAHAEAVAAAPPETRHVTDTVTDTSSQAEAERVAIRALQGVTDTVTDTQMSLLHLIADTVTVTGPALESFDTTKYRLGKLCQRGHDYQSTGQSPRTINKAGYCLACNAADARTRRHAKRQATAR